MAGSSRLRDTCKAALLPAVLCVVALTLASRGITSEATISLNGDMPRYLMNGVYFYDLIRDGVPTDVMQHARLYFAQYPALSLGHHPVLLPLAEVPFFALLGVSVAAGRVTMLFFLLLGLVTWFFFIKAAWDETVAFWSSLLVASSPLIVSQSRVVMSEIPVLSLTIASMYWYYRFSESGKTRDLVLVVISFVLACYAKQLAIFALPVFVVHFALRRGVRALFSRQVIVACAGLGVLLVPLVVMTLRFSATNLSWVTGANRARGFSLPTEQVFYYLRLMWDQGFVAPVVALGVLGIVGAVQRELKEAALFLLWIGFSFGLIVYTGLIDPRMAVYWLPPFALFAALSPRLVASTDLNLRFIAPKQAGRILSALLIVSVGYQIAAAYTAKTHYTAGYEEAAKYVADDPKGATILFSSWVDTGYFVFFVRKHDPERQLIVLRANKILSTSFYAETVEERVSDVDEIYRLLDDYGTCYIVIEDIETDSQAQNWLRQELKTDRFILRKQIPLETGESRLEGVSLLIHEYTECGPPRLDAMLDMDLPMGGFSIGVRLGDVLR